MDKMLDSIEDDVQLVVKKLLYDGVWVIVIVFGDDFDCFLLEFIKLDEKSFLEDVVKQLVDIVLNGREVFCNYLR